MGMMLKPVAVFAHTEDLTFADKGGLCMHGHNCY